MESNSETPQANRVICLTQEQKERVRKIGKLTFPPEGTGYVCRQLPEIKRFSKKHIARIRAQICWPLRVD
ncbi:MAG TPA: hypothetical protein ENI66_00945 [Candidatus Yonathbacteria bacterium]|nr:hypothetical protein [Candidatus Yonathbacteria bacterium]